MKFDSGSKFQNSHFIKLVESIDTEIDITLYFSRSSLSNSPSAQRFNSLAKNIKDVFEKASSANPKITFNYLEPKPYGDEYVKAITHGVKTLNINDNAGLLFGVTMSNMQDKGIIMDYFELGDFKNLLRNIGKNLLVLSKPRPTINVLSGIDLYDTKNSKKTFLLDLLSKWFSLNLLRGDELSLKNESPMLLLNPVNVPSGILDFIKATNVKVIIVWDPYTVWDIPLFNSNPSRRIDKELKKLLTENGINIVENEVLFDYGFPGKSFSENSSVKKSMPFFISCRDKCLKENKISSFNRLDFAFGGVTRIEDETSILRSSNTSWSVDVERFKSLNLYSNFYKNPETGGQKFSLISKKGRFLVFNDLDFLSEKFSGSQINGSFNMENDNFFFFLSSLNKWIFQITDPFSLMPLTKDLVRFEVFDELSLKNNKLNQKDIEELNSDANKVQDDIVKLEGLLSLTKDFSKKEAITDKIDEYRQKLFLSYQGIRLIEHSMIRKLETFKGLIIKLNYLCLILLFLTGLFVKKRLN